MFYAVASGDKWETEPQYSKNQYLELRLQTLTGGGGVTAGQEHERVETA